MTKPIAIVDLGGQTCHMISRRLRDLGVASAIVPSAVTADHVSHCAGIILSGGPKSVNAPNSPSIDDRLLDMQIPVLGICYGHQLLAKTIGGRVGSSEREYGHTKLYLKDKDTIFSGTPDEQQVWMNHSDSVVEMPKGVLTLATTERCKVAAFADVGRKYYGVQFHPEASHTTNGSKILENFAFKVCKLREGVSDTDLINSLTFSIREQVADKSVFFLVSGGVDSTVAFALCARALPPKRVLGVYVDTGLMREGETSELRSLLSELGLNRRLRIRNESTRFLSSLRGVTDPEKKRTIIGRLFIDVQSEACHEYGIDADHWLIGQGTIYPDTIESGGLSGTADLIKTHHNRCPEMVQLIRAGRVIEPLKEFYKDEVRQLGRSLGLSPRITERWPFPGPGLAIRVLCTTERARTTPKPTRVPIKSGYRGVSLPLRSVGVKGDARTFRNAVALEGPLDYERLQSLSSHLCNVGKAHNRVILRLAGRGEIENGRILPGRTLTPERIELLRKADFVVREAMIRRGLTAAVWQFPVVLIPVSLGEADEESIVLRPVDSEDGMTASFSKLDPTFIGELAEAIMKIGTVSAVFLDVSDKPPATIEWE